MLWFTLPAVLLYGTIYLIPTISGGVYAFTDWDGLSTPHFTGLANFSKIFTLSQGREAIENTIKLAVVTVVIGNVLALLLALALNTRIRTRNALRTICLLPALLSTLLAAYLWQFIFTPDGTLNRLLSTAGLGGLARPWLGDPATALWAVAVVIVWQSIGLTTTIYLAGLQAIPPELNEAMQVDGAPALARTRYLTVPLLAPSITVNVLLGTIGGLTTFGQVFAMTGGGPGYASETVATLIYKQITVTGRMGFAASASLTLAAFIFAIILLQWHYLRRRETAMA